MFAGINFNPIFVPRNNFFLFKFNWNFKQILQTVKDTSTYNSEFAIGFAYLFGLFAIFLNSKWKIYSQSIENLIIGIKFDTRIKSKIPHIYVKFRKMRHEKFNPNPRHVLNFIARIKCFIPHLKKSKVYTEWWLQKEKPFKFN